MRNRAAWLCVFLVLSQVADAFSQSNVDNATAVMLGDSEMMGFLNFPDLLPKGTVNLAEGGSVSADTTRMVTKALSYNPKSIFILIGTADFMLQDIDSIPKSYDTILTSIQTLSPNTTVYAQALFPENADSKPVIGNVNESIRKVVSIHSNAVYLDFTPSFAAPDGSLKSELNKDGIHLNPSGYELWGKLLRPYF